MTTDSPPNTPPPTPNPSSHHRHDDHSSVACHTSPIPYTSLPVARTPTPTPPTRHPLTLNPTHPPLLLLPSHRHDTHDMARHPPRLVPLSVTGVMAVRWRVRPTKSPASPPTPSTTLTPKLPSHYPHTPTHTSHLPPPHRHDVHSVACHTPHIADASPPVARTPQPPTRYPHTLTSTHTPASPPSRDPRHGSLPPSHGTAKCEGGDCGAMKSQAQEHSLTPTPQVVRGGG